MSLDKMKMEKLFIDMEKAKYNFAESGVPDYTLKEFFNKIKVNKKILYNISLGNNNTWGSDELRDVISATYKKVDKNNIIVSTGVSESLYIFFNLFIKKKTRVLCMKPSFPPLYLIPKKLAAKVYFFDLIKNKEKFLDNYLKNISKIKPDLLIINSPHNPTGYLFSVLEIEEISKLAKKLKITILFDEHYRHLPFSSSEILYSCFDVARKHYSKIFAVGSVIKCAGIVGTRVGWLIGDRKFLEKVRDYKDYTTHCVTRIDEKICELAIRNIEKLTANYLSNIKENYKLLVSSDLVKQKNIDISYELQGGCVIFLKINNYNIEELLNILYIKYNIFVMDGCALNKNGYIRVNLSLSPSKFKYFLKSLKTILAKKNEKN